MFAMTLSLSGCSDPSTPSPSRDKHDVTVVSDETSPTDPISSADYQTCASTHILQTASASPKENGMVFITGGRFMMGHESILNREEGPVHPVDVSDFWISAHEVTNAQFAAFVSATNYVTLAEKQPEAIAGAPARMNQPGSAVFSMPSSIPDAAEGWWDYVPGANWRHPEGPGSTLEGREHHPVVHIAFTDAVAYADWLGHSLPTEAQFEFAARGGLESAYYAWGDTFMPDKVHRANTWQGFFPVQNSASDGYLTTAPGGCYEPNGYELYDMIGNVWEWTGDWYQGAHTPANTPNPTGPSSKDAYTDGVSTFRVIKGGSFLCADNYCARYRPAARHPQDTGLGTNHVGFRTVVNISQ